MSKLLLILFVGSILFTACSKENFGPGFEPQPTCEFQTDNPVGRSYSSSAVINYNCTQKFCGILPLSSKNYWVYEDSIFTNGVFISIQIDTLRFSSFYKTPGDELVWWKSSISIGLPDIFYSNDSSFFGLNDRMYNPDIKDVKKDYGLFPGDSIRWLASFEDNAAAGRSVRLSYPVTTPAGDFDQCILFEKDARNYRRDRVIFRPGLGVIRYTREKAPVGGREIKLQQVSTLVAYHIE